MAVKIVHLAFAHELRFANRDAAQHYARQNGGLDAWQILPVEDFPRERWGRPAVLGGPG
ncbi:hypothetical protein IQ251_04605 [Saccharopolyspora sp. HNM0983]|uniref:Uncharacterized protein n=1 Tax=Saccharopolyspora montiporae TaxID=2781240 RepID=A0A929B9P7_9PSEU|nr:hypothetical protein [Saccharopolyspora sp. HNM0983]MBE9373728.1 hypothetical protein [Saccharopolyspora sp. HNM0983]